MKRLNSLRLFSLIAIITFSSIQAGLRKNTDDDRMIVFDSEKDLVISEKDRTAFNSRKKGIEDQIAALPPIPEENCIVKLNSTKKDSLNVPPRSTPKPTPNLPQRPQPTSRPNLPQRPQTANRTLPSPVKNIPNGKVANTAQPNLPQRPQPTSRPNLPARTQSTRALPVPAKKVSNGTVASATRPALPKRPGIRRTPGVNFRHQENKRILTSEEKSLEIQNQHPLIKAVIEDNIDEIKKIMRKDPSAVNLNSSIGTPLHIAVKKENMEMIKFLLEKKADVDSVAFDSKLRPLHLAVKKGSLPIVGLLVNKWGTNVDCQDQNKLTPLYYALENYPNNQEIIRCLLKNNANIDIAEHDYKLTFLHKAVQEENESFVDFLLTHGADPNCTDRDGLTPFHYALKKSPENINIIKKLLDNGAYINFNSSIGASLHIAVEKQNIKMIEYFLKNHANINIQDLKTGNTPLHLAVQNGYFDGVKLLVDRGAIVDCQNIKKLTPLYYALKNYPKNKDIIEYLLKNKADINIVEQGSKLTHLHKAAEEGNEALVDFLLKHKANPNCTDRNGLTPLHYALKSSHANIKIIENLLNHGANVNNADYKLKLTPLHLAALKGNLRAVKLLVDKKASVDCKDQDGLTPLHHALENHHKEISSFFLGDKYPLHRAIIENNIQEARKILEKNSNLNTVINLTTSIGTPIHLATRIALETKNTGILSLLLEKGADINAISSGFPKENIDITAFLLDHGVDKKDIKSGSQSFTPLHMAAEKGQLPLVQFLIEHHANPNCTDRDGLTPLHYALKNGHKQTSCFLFNKTELTTVGLDGQSPLHYAVKYGLSDVVEVLSPKDSILIRTKDKDDQTPLHYAVNSGSLDMVNALLRKIPKNFAPEGANIKIDIGAEIEINPSKYDFSDSTSIFIDAKDTNGHTPLHLASRLGYYDIFLTLLEHSANVSTKNNAGWTLLFFDKALPGQKDIATYLINKCTVSVNTTDKTSSTALHFAARSNNILVAQALLESGKAEVNAQDNLGFTPLHSAAQNENLAMIKLLIAFNADLTKKTKDKKTAQDIAKDQENFTFAELLNTSYKPLHFLVATKDVELTRRYLEKNTQHINSQDNLGFTPLHLATQSKNREIVDLLLEYSAKTLKKTKSNEGKVTAYGLATATTTQDDSSHQIKSSIKKAAYPLNHAVENNNLKDVKQILNNLKKYDILTDLNVTENPLNKTDEDGFEPIHYAAKNGNAEIAKLLILRGANLKIKSDANKTGDTAKTAQEIAQEHGHDELAQWIDPSFTSIHFAVASGNLILVEDLLKDSMYKSQINTQDAKGLTPLHLAVQNKNMNIVNILLTYNAKTSLKSKNGQTAYQLALEMGETEIAKKIKSFVFPLHDAIETKDFAFVRSIPTNGSVNKLDEEGLAPIHIAAKYNVDMNIIILLAMRGAKFDIKSQDGKTAQDIAREYGHNELADILDPSYSILHFAAALNDAKLFGHLFSQTHYQAKNATPDSRGFTPFHIAGKNLSAAQEKQNRNAIDNALEILKIINEKMNEEKSSVTSRLKSAAPGFRGSIHLGKVKGVKSLIKKGGGSIGKMFKTKDKKEQ